MFLSCLGSWVLNDFVLLRWVGDGYCLDTLVSYDGLDF